MRNALMLRDSIKLHCEGNPFIMGTPLKGIVSSVLIPEAAKEDILSIDEMRRDCRFIKSLFRNICLTQPSLCGI